MNQCCNTSEPTKAFPAKYRCPVNGKEYATVSSKTILHHIKNPWNVHLAQQGYYFCTDPNCDVVYFGQDDSVIPKSHMRSTIWQKDSGKDNTLCYCFGVTVAQTHNRDIKDFVTQKTKESLCSCEIANPSGRCCLKDFPKT